MTKEEAVKLLSQIMDTLLASNSWLPSTDNPIKEAFGMAISTLQAQESCNNLVIDTISKQAAIDALGEAPEVWMDTPEEFAALNQWEYDMAAIKAVPSVQRKKGKWIARKDCEGKTRRITCNLCSWQSHSLCWYDYNYCPNCGAKMEGERYEK